MDTVSVRRSKLLQQVKRGRPARSRVSDLWTLCARSRAIVLFTNVQMWMWFE
jgi:hypothetical protein